MLAEFRKIVFRFQELPKAVELLQVRVDFFHS
jgi:hypothetical protein